jgi:hypothetical protein
MTKDEAWEMIDSALDHCYSEKDVMKIKEALDVPETNFGNIAAQKPTDIAALVEGMDVSIDVSTGEHDSNNRLFGTVTLAQENQGSKHGLILLVQEPTPNFKVSLVQELGEYDANLLNDYGGGNVEWWQDYIRYELGCAYEHYKEQLTTSPAQPAIIQNYLEKDNSQLAQTLVGKWTGKEIEWTENPYKFKQGQNVYTTLPAAPVQDGWILVPVTLTNDMTSAMADVLEDPNDERSSWDLAENMWRAMLTKAPTPPAAPKENT